MRGFEIVIWSQSSHLHLCVQNILCVGVFWTLFSLDFKIKCQWFICHQLFPALFFLTLSKIDELFRVRARVCISMQPRVEWRGMCHPTLSTCATPWAKTTCISIKCIKAPSPLEVATSHFLFCFVVNVSNDRNKLEPAKHWELGTTLTDCGQWVLLRRRKPEPENTYVTSFIQCVNCEVRGTRVGMGKHLESSKNMFLLCGLVKSLLTLKGHSTSHEVPG